MHLLDVTIFNKTPRNTLLRIVSHSGPTTLVDWCKEINDLSSKKLTTVFYKEILSWQLQTISYPQPSTPSVMVKLTNSLRKFHSSMTPKETAALNMRMVVSKFSALYPLLSIPPSLRWSLATSLCL